MAFRWHSLRRERASRMSAPIPVIVGVAAATVAVVVTGCGNRQGEPQQSSPTGQSASQEYASVPPVYLWSMASANGSLVGPDDENLRLSMTGVDRLVTRFTDRPDRTSTAVDTRDFFERWDERFSAVPPNAVLSYNVRHGQPPTQIVVMLTNPRYDPQADTLSFDADRIRRQADDLPDTDYPVTPPKIDNPTATGPLAVFIDTLGGSDVAAPADPAAPCTPTVMVVRHAEDESNPAGGPDVLSVVGKKHAALYPEFFRKYLSKTHAIGPGGTAASVCSIGKIIAIDPKPNGQNNSPGTNPYETIRPLAEALRLPIRTKDAAGVSYSTVYDWTTARRKSLLDNGTPTPTSTVLAWDKQGLNPSTDDSRNKSINGKRLEDYGFVPVLQALPTDANAIVGAGAYYTPQRTDFYLFSLQDPDSGSFALAKSGRQSFSDDDGATWYNRTALSVQDNPNDIKS